MLPAHFTSHIDLPLLPNHIGSAVFALADSSNRLFKGHFAIWNVQTSLMSASISLPTITSLSDTPSFALHHAAEKKIMLFFANQSDQHHDSVLELIFIDYVTHTYSKNIILAHGAQKIHQIMVKENLIVACYQRSDEKQSYHCLKANIADGMNIVDPGSIYSQELAHPVQGQITKMKINTWGVDDLVISSLIRLEDDSQLVSISSTDGAVFSMNGTPISISRGTNHKVTNLEVEVDSRVQTLFACFDRFAHYTKESEYGIWNLRCLEFNHELKFTQTMHHLASVERSVNSSSPWTCSHLVNLSELLLSTTSYNGDTTAQPSPFGGSSTNTLILGCLYQNATSSFVEIHPLTPNNPYLSKTISYEFESSSPFASFTTLMLDTKMCHIGVTQEPLVAQYLCRDILFAVRTRDYIFSKNTLQGKINLLNDENTTLVTPPILTTPICECIDHNDEAALVLDHNDIDCVTPKLTLDHNDAGVVQGSYICLTALMLSAFCYS
jgi:hypothetical protein